MKTSEARKRIVELYQTGIISEEWLRNCQRRIGNAAEARRYNIGVAKLNEMIVTNAAK